ncbi:MAG: histidine kinase, partial [Desulfuromonas sp.]
REVLRNSEERLLDVVRFSSHSLGLVAALKANDMSQVQRELEAIRRREGLDLLNLTDTEGKVLVRSTAPDQIGDRPELPFLTETLEGEERTGVMLFSADQLKQEGERLVRRARIATPDSLPRPLQVVEDRGMFIYGAAGVHDGAGDFLGCLYAGVLLNGNLPLVDRIREIVYGHEQEEGGDVLPGSATIFLNDLRVATTIRLADGARALGTRVSPEVSAAVLERKETWLARAEVVDQWYLTAYEPILDDHGAAIGALYVGLLEAPFVDLRHKAWLLLLLLLLFGSGLGYVLARLGARHISRPILNLASGAERIAAGARDITLPVSGDDEVGHLTGAFNRMTAALKDRDQRLGQLNRELERKVVLRTQELEEKSLQLLQAREELLRSEKLAAIGSLAAGVAHEINNPAAIIRGNVEILLMEMPPGREGREEAEEILKQTERVSLITRNLLTFAREQAFHRECIQVNILLQEILAQVTHQVSLEQIELTTELAEPLPPIIGDAERLRQVFTNMVVNAVQAMEGVGSLTVSSKVMDRWVDVAIRDTGPGVPDEIREKIFNPFFTTKKQGTGLGLSVSYGIVRALGGNIEVESDGQSGSIFHVRLPTNSPAAEDS